MNASETLPDLDTGAGEEKTREREDTPDPVSRRSILAAVLASAVATKLGKAGSARAMQSSDATPLPAATPETTSATGTPTNTVVVAEATEAGEPRSGGAVRLVRPGVSVSNFNPSAFAQDPQIPLSYLEPLVRPDATTLVPRPHLATGWEWRAGGRELVLTLRDDVTWHDGSPLTAEDAAFSYSVYAEDSESAVSQHFQLVEVMEARSAHELFVQFRERDGSWLFNAATLPVFSARQYAAHWEATNQLSRTLSGFDWATSLPMGTGPWRVSEWAGRTVTFERNEDYWGRGTWLDRLEIAVEPGYRERAASWIAGESALLWPVRGQDLAGLPPDAGYVRTAPAASVMFAAFNFANPNQVSGSIWNDLRVRRAASMAIDRERYAREVFAGNIQWDAAGTIAQPWAHDEALLSPSGNQEAAAILLAEAGWLDYNGDGIREDVNGMPMLVTAILQEGSRPELAAVLARVARDFASVGISLNVEALSAADFEDRWIRSRDFDLIAYAYDQLPGFSDFDLYGSAWDIRFNPAGWNPGGYANPEADAAIDAFLSAVTVERQAAALTRLQRAVNEDLFGLWFGFPDDLILVGQGIEGFAPDMAWQTARTWDLWRASEV